MLLRRLLLALAALPLLGAAQDSGPAPQWPITPEAPAGAPNIVVILLDDIGFADTSAFGGLAQTPALEKIAAKGIIYNNFNVTAMCSPTRAALLTGHNHHATGFAAISEYAAAFPGYDSYWKQSTASVAQVLRQNGYNTAAIGKWHNTPEWEISSAGPFDRWPTGLGFEYFYGFMGAEDNQWEPDRLYLNTTPIEAPKTPGKPYHLTADLADKAIAWLADHRSIASQKPYFLYLATGGVHSPHHAPADWIARFKGRYDAGWDVLRAQVLARQKRLGVVPADAALTPRPAAIPAWASLSNDQRRLYTRQMEVYAAYVAYTDHHVGRVLQAIGDHENTLIFYIVGDNGALGTPLPGYGGNASLAENLARLDAIGGPDVPFNQSQGGWGWLGNTPFQYWKSVASHFGGLRAPMVVSWPRNITPSPTPRSQFTHITDIAPTIYQAIGITPPKVVGGVAQQPLDGVSILPQFADPQAPSAHKTQYFELLGNRGLYSDGWMASALNARNSPSGSAEDWELYNIAKDFSQSRNIAAQHPEKLSQLKALFDREARANFVYPLNSANFRSETKPFPTNGRTRFDFHQAAAMIPYAQLPKFNRAFSLEAEVEIPTSGASGVLATFGFKNKGFAWYLQNGHMVYENHEGVRTDIVTSSRPLSAGKHILRAQFACDSCTTPGASFKTISGTLSLHADGQLAATHHLASVNLANAGESLALHLGKAGGSRISDRYTAPYPLTGTLKRLTITLD